MGSLRVISSLLAVSWLLAGGAAWRGGRRRTAQVCLVLAVVHGAAAASAALAPLAVAGWLYFGLSVPTGRLGSATRVAVAAVGSLPMVGWSVLLLQGGGEPAWPVLIVAVLAVAAVGTVAAAVRCGRAEVGDRRALQWLAAAVILAAAFDVVCLALHVLVDAPESVRAWLLGSLLLVPAAQTLLAWTPAARMADAVLVEAVVLAGLAVLVVVVYLVVIVGLGHPPEAGERDVMLSSIVAAVVVAALALPVRHRLVAYGTALVGGRQTRAEEVVGSFGARMSRALPMDELLLQLVESLRATMAPGGAEIWVGSDGVLTRTVSVPSRPDTRLVLGEHERIVVGRARTGGPSWTAMWLPQLLDPGPGADLRVAPVAHLGELLGLIVVRRSAEDPFGEDDERQLVDLARQLGLALHNVRLDSALQASLAELKERNAELQASRLRIVTASDEARRAIERNLHDGAQQQLVALAVRLGLAAQIAPEEPEAVPVMLEELRTDVQSTIRELRELAHGIYPPLLRDRGLGEALRAAANRSPLPCRVDVELPGRYPLEVETAAYFCCLEALQNAGKHAGTDATVTVRVGADDSRIWFEVQDDGAGFDASAASGHGFVNMRDRLGALGGSLSVDGLVGAGTTVRGSVPATPLGALDGRGARGPAVRSGAAQQGPQ
jgi:signal transduction histidine kinase